MPKIPQSSNRKVSDQFFQLKPLVAGIRIVVVGGLFVSSPTPVRAELPVAGATLPDGTALPWVGYGDASNHLANNGHNLVIDQHSEKAILNWQHFNVGKDNTVQFVQPDGSAVALNRIYDANGSTILGHITANGQIYLYNQNGFVFEKGAVIDANSVVVSTMNVSDDVFKNSNIVDAYNSKGVAAFDQANNADPSQTPGNVNINKGAQIKAADGGRIIVAGANVQNNGSLSAGVQGQILLVASQDKVYLQANNPAGGSAWNGLLVEVGTGGKVTNAGDVAVRQGNVTLAGFAVNQDGRVNATTSVNVNGSIRLQAAQGLTNGTNKSLDGVTTAIAPAATIDSNNKASSVEFGAGSQTQINADSAGGSSLDSAVKPQSAIEIVSNTVALNGNAAITAPGAKVSITATDDLVDPTQGHSGRIFMDSKASIDVSGLKDVKVAANRNIAEISVESYELRNSPLQLTGVLKGANVWVDTSVNTSIIDTSKAAANIQRSIYERMTVGGQIDMTSSGDVLVDNNAKLSITGGSVDYQAGYVHTTKLINDFGQLVDISAADPNQHYAGIYGQITEAHTKWGVTQTWNVFDQAAPGTYRTAYTQGANAGAVNITTSALSWNGELAAGANSGANQRTLANTPNGGSFNIDLATLNSVQNVQFQTAQNFVDFTPTSAFPKNANTGKPNDLILDAGLLNGSGVQSVSVKTTTNVLVTADDKINMQAGGQLSVSANNININGSIHAAGGAVNLTTITGDITLSKQAVVDVSGRWINDQQAVLQQPGLVPTAPLYTQGGSVNFNAYDVVKLPSGAQIKADGGGWVSAVGALTGGAGGSIDLESASNNGGIMQLAGGLSAYGMNQGGTLTLGSNNMVIGTAGTGDPATALVLGVSHNNFDFAQQLGFSTINLKGNIGSNTGNISVKSDAKLNLKTENLLLHSNFHSMATGSSIRDFSSVVLLPENQRQAVKLSLTGGDSALNIAQGSSIVLDKSTLNNASTLNLTSQGSIFVDGTLNAAGGQINLTINPDMSLAYDPTQAVWLGQHAKLLATGDTRLNPADGLGRQTGVVLNGGAININVQRGYAVLETGSLLDVSGTHAQVAIPQQTATGYNAGTNLTDVGSNAGKVSITAAEGAVLDGTFKAFAGSATTQAGSLTVTMNNFNRNISDTASIADTFSYGSLTINVEQDAGRVLANGTAFGSNLDQLNLQGKATLSTNTIMAGGFADVSLVVPSNTSTSTGQVNGQVNFIGNVDLNATGHITIDSPIINSLPLAGETSDTVKLTSPYITLGSSTTRSVSSTATTGNGVFESDAIWTQLQGASQWNGFSNISLNSAHDLRTLGVSLLTDRDFLGEMVTAATINLQASQIYPATLTDFTFQTTGANQQINITGSNTDTSPLSAGGSITFQAPIINQSGVIKAPLGTINLQASQKLTLGANSLTSVSAAGLVIPFGVVQGGLDWLYPLDNGQNLIIATPPTKQVNLSAPVIDQVKGSTVDLSGGGDLLSSEFKPVTSDFPDFLKPGSSSYDGSFAVIPSLGSALAPYDPATMLTWNNAATGTAYAEGSQVYLQGSADLPAGQYTILPAYYALLPGAYLITPQANSQDRSVTTYSTSGLPIVSGYETLAGTAVKDARTSAFQVETSAQLLLNHPQYDLYCAGSCSTTLTSQETALKAANQGVLAANIASGLDYLTSKTLLTQNFYAAKAKTNSAATPLLPVDSGQITIAAQQGLTLDGAINVAAPGGRGASMDIAADNIEVVSSLSATPAPDTLQILDSNLNNLKVDSLFLGGTRTTNEDSFTLIAPASSGSTSLTLVSTVDWAVGDVVKGTGIADGTVINSISGNTVTLSKAITTDLGTGTTITDTNTALINGATNLAVTAQQVIFDSGVNLKLTDLVAAATDKVVVNSGTNLTASGTVNTGESKFNLLGDSALLRLSADQQLAVNRVYYGTTPGQSGQLAVDKNATLSATKSMLLDSSLSTQVDGNIVMHGGSLYLSAGNINIGDVGSGAALQNALNLSNQQLAGLNVDQLILNSRGNVSFYGNVGAEDSSGNQILGSDGSQLPLNFNQLVINAGGISGYTTSSTTPQAVKFKASSLTLENLNNAGAGSAGTGNGTLDLTATNYIQGPGNMAINGFNSVNLTVTNSFTASGTSNLTLAGDTTLTTGYLTANSGAKLSLDASGHTLNVNGNGAASSATPAGLGGTMSFVADSVGFNAYALLPSGNLTLQAKGSTGNVSIGSSANIDLAGRAVAYANTVDYTPGGQLSATADHGNVTVAGNAKVDLSSGGGTAAAGNLLLNAVEQSVSIADTASIKASGGSAQFDVATFSSDSSFDKLMTVLKNAGINNIIDFRSRAADINSTTDINAKAVTLVADHNKIEISGKINANGVSGAYQTTAVNAANVLTLADTRGLHVGDYLSGPGLAANTVITKISGNDVSLSTTPNSAIAAGATITDISALGNTHTITGISQTAPNSLTLDNTTGLKVGEYLLGAGLAANTTITGISGNTITLSSLPSADLSTGTAVITVDSSRVGDINGGSIKLYAGDTITLDKGSNLTATSVWGKGGEVLLSSLAASSTTGAIVLNSGAVVDVSGVNAAQGGSVTLRALQDGNSINIHTLNATLTGYTALNAEAVKVYTNADFNTSPGADGTIDASLIAAIQAATQTFMANADISALTAQNAALTLLPGVEIDYTGNLTLADLWDLSTWRYNGNPGDLVIRASNSLTFNNSLSDGFTSGNFINADGSSGTMTVTDQLMRDQSWSFTLSAGADLASADINRVSGTSNNVTIGNADNVADGGGQIQVRTGTGNIHINAGGDINIMGNGTVYSAGQASTSNPYGHLTDSQVSKYFFVEYPINGGNLDLAAGGNINGAYSGTTYNDWLLRICCDSSALHKNPAIFIPTAWGVALGYTNSSNQLVNSNNAPAFTQNIGSFGGGNVSIKASGNIQNLEVAMPTTGKPVGATTTKPTSVLASFTSNVIDIEGGGTLQVSAGGDIQGGSYYLGKGIADINAGGAVTVSSAWTSGPQLYSGDTQFNVNAVTGVQLAGVADPMMNGVSHLQANIRDLQKAVNFFSYTDASALSLRSLAGDIILTGGSDLANVFPASLQVSAFGGSLVLNNNINLFPSSTAKLNVYAQQNITSANSVNPATLRMLDYAPNATAGALPTAYAPNLVVKDITIHAVDASNMPLHIDDLLPAVIATQSGDIHDIGFNIPKLTIIKAGRDISNANISIQNIHNSDVSIVDAGRDLIYPLQLSPNTGKIISLGVPPQISVAGPGDLLLKAGRNVDLGAAAGVFTIGDRNVYNASGAAETNSALIRPYYVSAATQGSNAKQLTLANTKGLVVGEQLIGTGLAGNTLITAINGNTVTLSAAPSQTLAAGTVFSTADTSANVFTQAAASTNSYQLKLLDASGLLVGEHLTGTGLADNTIITAISGNTVTLNEKPLQALAAGALLTQTTKDAPGAYVADINNGANITVLAGLQGTTPSYSDFINSETKLKDYIAFLQKNEQQLQSNGSAQALLDIYTKAISQFQALLPVFDTSNQAATALIVNFMQQQAGYVYTTDAQALTDFKALPVDQTLALQGQLNDLLLPVLLSEIRINGGASASDKAFGNDQAYAALDAFFNRSTGSWLGDINMYFSTLQTQSGGDINLLAPGGLVNAGLAVAVGFDTPKAASQLGIIAQGQGAVNALVGQDFLVNTSRVFTLDGGDILLWSSHGNIDAGKGAKSALSIPPLSASYIDGNLVYTQAPSVSGSGIRTQGLVPGNVYLFAPQGVVNAAEAGIAGKNVTISATAVLGAQNISFSGVSTGVPQASTGSLAAGLTGSSNLGASVSQIAQSAVEDDSKGKNSSMKNSVLGLLSVELLGFGD